MIFPKGTEVFPFASRGGRPPSFAVASHAHGATSLACRHNSRRMNAQKKKECSLPISMYKERSIDFLRMDDGVSVNRRNVSYVREKL